MASKVQPAENYWTDDVKMTWKVQPAADYWTVDRENMETGFCYFGERKNKERNGETPSRTGTTPCGRITPSFICRILDILRKSDSIIVKYSGHWRSFRWILWGFLAEGKILPCFYEILFSFVYINLPNVKRLETNKSWLKTHEAT